MRTLTRILGIAVAAMGVLALAPAVVLLNQQLHLVRMSWGIFDIQANGVAVSPAATESIFRSVGTLLVVLGVVLIRGRRQRAG